MTVEHADVERTVLSEKQKTLAKVAELDRVMRRKIYTAQRQKKMHWKRRQHGSKRSLFVSIRSAHVEDDSLLRVTPSLYLSLLSPLLRKFT